MPTASHPQAIAIVGIGCRFPGGANTPGQFWKLLCEGVDAITEVPPERFNLEAVYDADPGKPGKLYARWAGFVADVDRFDADFFGISPREARRMDPQHRLLLEAVWNALEDAGQVPERLAGTDTGVYVGISAHDYSDLQVLPNRRHLLDAYSSMASAAFTAANRISFLLDLHGPSIAVDSACSSSLTAVHLACQQLARGEGELAIAGAVNLCLTPEPIIGLCRAGMLSPDGRSRAFDARANGYVRGEGAGAVVLKPLARARADGDPIYAVILASVINQDGRTVSFSIPNADAQEAMLRQALHEAGVEPGAVQYVEAHGTGTPVGDPLEATAIGRVFGRGRSEGEACLVGSVKTNIGHLEAGAGIAGLIKTVLALGHRQIPPNLHFSEANPEIPLDELRLRVPTRLEPWPAPPGEAIAGVSSFGFGGSNAHVLLGEPPEALTPRPHLPPGSGGAEEQRGRGEGQRSGGGDGEARVEPVPGSIRGGLRAVSAANSFVASGEGGLPRSEILSLSGRTPQALHEMAERYARFLAENESVSLHDLCYTAALRRSHHEHRLAAVVSSREELGELLAAFLRDEERTGLTAGSAGRGREPKLAFVFSGMGPQWWGMGRQLLREEPVFRETLGECDRLLRPLAGWSLLEELAADEATSRVNDADLAHVSNLALQLALAALWRSWGIVPDVVVGHSSGEMAASCVAGALQLPGVLHLAYHRGRLQHRLAGTGRMLAAGLSAAAAQELIAEHDGAVSLAAINSPGGVTLSGTAEALERIAAELERRQLFHRFLQVDVPYHGPQMEALREELLECLRELHPRAAAIPIVSSVSGNRAEGELFDAMHWWRNLREPVRFLDAVDQLLEEGCELFVEVGPHPVASASLAECVAHRGASATVLPTLRRREDERAVMLRTLAALHVRGCRVEWSALYPTGTCLRLPTYAWQRERHWIEADSSAGILAPRGAGTETGHPLLGRRLRSPRSMWEAELEDARLAFLDEHVVQESVVFPGAGYVEMVLAAAQQIRGDAPAAAERIEFRKLLFLGPREQSLLQLHHHPEHAAVEIHAAPRGDDLAWELHATATLSSLAAGVARDALDLRAIRERCRAPAEPQEFYRSFERHGLRYGAAFRGIRELWLGEGEAFGRIALEASLAGGADAYRVHPALLDAAFQVLGSAADKGAASKPGLEGPLVPTSIRYVASFGSPGAGCWAHAVLTRRTDGEIEGDVHLLGDAGNVLLHCQGLRLQALAPASPDRSRGEWFYEMRWEEVPLRMSVGPASRPLPRASAIAADVREVMRSSSEAIALQGHYEVVEPALHQIALHFVRSALRKLGWEADRGDRDPAALAEALGVVPQHRQLFTRLLEILATDPTALSGNGSDPAGREFSAGRLSARVLADHPDHGAEFELLERCGSRLAEVLRGELDPRELLFGDSLEALTRLYRTSPISRHYNEIAAEAVATAARRSGASAPLRLLEVGAGTGGLTSAILPRLLAGTVDYHFTDLSPYFLARAQKEFGDRQDIHFGVLDVEVDPEEQQLVPGSFDLVLAANVLHATPDLRGALARLRRLLAPGGLLVLLEVTRRAAWIELIFGMLEGWWRFADRDLRPTHALLSQEEWPRPLAEAGFEDVAVLADPPRDGGTMETVILARAPLGTSRPATRTSAPGRRWLLLAGRHGVSDRVAAALREHGDGCILVHPGGGFFRCADDCFEISPASRTDAVRLLDELHTAGGTIDGVLHLWSLDAPGAADATTAQVMEAQWLGCESALNLIQALEQSRMTPQLWLVTAGAQAVDGEGVPGVTQAPLWGLGRVLRNEQPVFRSRLVDLGPTCAAEEIEGLIAELHAGESAAEIALRGHTRWVHHLRRAAPAGMSNEAASLHVTPDVAAFQLEIGTPGALETLGLREVAATGLGPGQVRIRVLAEGVNYRDVILALGMLPAGVSDGAADAGTLSVECAGIVLECGEEVDSVRPGDEVIALAIGAPGSHATARQELVVPKPPRLSFEEAASISGIYLTAAYALNHLARIAAGERVLIHSATGGVGHAAVEICRRAGAEIFATAGSAEKRDYLRSQGIEHVFDSRSLAWADEILDRTGGEGVDVVLNSLAGAGIRRGLEVLRPFGRFVEIGKRDIYQDAAIGLLPFRKHLSFFALDLVRLCDERPAATGAMLREIVARVADGTLAPPPRSDFDMAHAEQAYRLMAQARHSGKLVLTVQHPEYLVRPSADRPLFRADASYLVTGGLGGFGLAVAEWMVAQGARHLVLMSRSGEPKDNQEALRRLEAAADVRVVRADVGREQEIARVLDTIRAEMPPLRGVFHLAMVLDDALLGELDRERLHTVLQPKVAGAWNLHRLTRADALDHFVLFSSIASVTGHPLQGNYAAANAFLDLLAPHRRALGLPAVAISWGTVAEVGYVSRHEEIQQHLVRLGVQSFTPGQALTALQYALRQGSPHLVAARLEWSTLQKWNRTPAALEEEVRAPEQESSPDGVAGAPEGLLAQLRIAAPEEGPALLEAYLLQRVAKVLGTTPQRVDPERPLPEMGLDSLLAVELLTVLKLDLGIQIPVVQLLRGTSTRELVSLILQQLCLDPAPVSSTQPATVQGAAAHHGESFPLSRTQDRGSAGEGIATPLSFEQRRFWFLDRLSPGNPAYNLFAAARLSGPLDTSALQRSIEEVARRHEVLRTSFAVIEGEPLQVIAPSVAIPLPLRDLRHLSSAEREEEVQRLTTAEIQQPFDLSHAPLLRALLVRLEEEEHAILLTTHHIAADAWAMTLLVQEVMTLYDGFAQDPPAPLPEPSARYADYVRWQAEALTEEVAVADLAYWKRQLAGAPPALSLPCDRPHPAVRSFRGGHVPFEFSPELSDGLRELSRREGVTLFTTLLAAFQALLHRYSGEADICVGAPVLTRNRPGLEELVGCCMNTLVLRSDLAGDPPFRELLRRVQETTLGALAHQELPFDKVVEALRPQRHAGRSPLFQAMLILHNLHWPELRMDSLAVQPLEVESGTAVADLALLVDTGERLHGSLEYSADLFEPATAARMLEHLRTLLEGIVAAPEQRLSSLPLLGEAERSRVLVEWNATTSDFGEPHCLHELFEAQAARTPDAVAVVSDTEHLTCQELDRRANRLARHLRRLGVGPDTVVGVCLERSPDLVTALLAVLKAGGAYLPLDPAYPRPRLAFMLRDARARVLISQQPLVARFDRGAAEPVLLDAHAATLEKLEPERPEPLATPANLAYVLYTSGSTGPPKGVLVEHRAIWNQLMWRQAAFPLTLDDAVLQRTPIGFDPSIWEFFAPLAVGARLVLPPPGSEADIHRLARLIAERQVTTLQVTPSLLAVLLQEPELETCRSLRRIFCGGEVLSSELVRCFIARLPAVELHNLYGPTEAAIDVTCWSCDPADERPSVPIGRPINNVQTYVINASLQPVPVGVAGELYIAGAGLARGYLNRPELTAECFVPNPFSNEPGARLYRTGDRARWLPDGNLEFLGRLDDQVKIRGYRVEPAEVEAVLRQHSAVREAVVVARRDRTVESRLVAYVAGTPHQQAGGERLRQFLAERLPGYLVPSAVLVLEALPRLANGKVDRAALALPDATCDDGARPYVAPRDSTESRLVQLWEDFLDVRPVGVTDSFFDLGGHSLAAARLVSRLRREFGRELPLASLFRAATIEELARLLRRGGRPAGRSPLVPIQPHGRRPRFYCVHPTSGDVFCYHELARLLGEDQPFFGLQAPGLEAGEEPLSSIETLAEHHLAALRKMQPEGPYLLGGWSLGAVIAYEMAQRLTAQGGVVPLLALFDAAVPGVDFVETEENDELLRRFARGIGVDPDRVAIRLTAEGEDNPEQQIARLLEQLRTADLLPGGIELPQLRRYLQVFRAHSAALRAYVPAPYPGSLTLFTASERDERGDGPASAWESLGAGGIVVHRIPADHYSILRPPSVRQLAQLLTGCIQEACSVGS